MSIQQRPLAPTFGESLRGVFVISIALWCVRTFWYAIRGVSYWLGVGLLVWVLLQFWHQVQMVAP